MLYIMPRNAWDTYNVDGGQYKLLNAACAAIKDRYPKTEIYVDRLVVRVLYESFHVEVQPVFESDDGSFKYPDTYSGGSWKITKPRDEIDTTSQVDLEKNGNLRRLAKMARAWKNKHGIGMGGLLIDTLAHNFLTSRTDHDNSGFAQYGPMSRDFFDYLASLPHQDYFAALGSRQRVKVKANFQRKAKIAHELCLKALEADGTSSQNAKWRKVYGRQFPADISEVKKQAFVTDSLQHHRAANTEEFFEDRFAYDVRYNIELECEVSRDGYREFLLSRNIARYLRLKRHRSLRFFVASHDMPGSFQLYWKVLNRGPEAIRRNCIRGQIVMDTGRRERKENSLFFGDHLVECVAVSNGIVVATSQILVPIEGGSDE